MNKEWNTAMNGLEEWKAANVKAIRPMPQRRTLIIHVNSFTGKIAGGYIAQCGVKWSATMTPKEIALTLIDEIDVCVEFMKV